MPTLVEVTSYDLNSAEELLWALALGFVFTSLRWIANLFVLGHPGIRQIKAELTKAERLFEEVWLMILSTVLLVVSWTVFLENKVGASITQTLPIVNGWPHNTVSTDVIQLLRVETGWYIHQVTRSWTASGVPLDRLMFYHHVGTLLIIRFCFWKNLLLCGVLTVSIFNISNPFLHLSKVAYVMDWRRVRVVLFTMFGLAFLFSRIVMFPMTIMKMGYVDAYLEDYKSFGENLLLLGNIMMLVLYALQLFWMFKILKVLSQGRTGTTPKKSETQRTVFSDDRPVENGKEKEN